MGGHQMLALQGTRPPQEIRAKGRIYPRDFRRLLRGDFGRTLKNLRHYRPDEAVAHEGSRAAELAKKLSRPKISH